MHPKQNENILENVRKTKLKNMKTGKSSLRKMNNVQKKEIKKGKLVKVTNGVEKIDINRSGGEIVQVIAKDKVEQLETELNHVELFVRILFQKLQYIRSRYFSFHLYYMHLMYCTCTLTAAVC